MSNPAVRPFNSVFINKPNPFINVSAADRSVTVGDASTLAANSAAGSTRIGFQTRAGGVDSIAVGKEAEALATRSIVIGDSTTDPVGDDCIMIGDGHLAVGGNGVEGVAIGKSLTIGQNSVALGSDIAVPTGEFGVGVQVAVAAGSATGTFLRIHLSNGSGGTVPYKLALLADA